MSFSFLASLYWQEGKWQEALEQYSMGLESLTLSEDQKGLLLSNRALCFLKLSR